MVNKDDLKQQAVLKFTDFTKRNANQDNTEQTNLTSKEELQAKVSAAKMYGFREIEKFKKATEKYLQEIEELCLFEGASSTVSEILIGYLLETIIEPTLRGKRIPGMDNDDFQRFRGHLYRALINHYIDKK